VRRRDTQHQTRGRKDAVVRAQYRRAQPADMFRAMPFPMAYRHSRCLLGREGMIVQWGGLTLQEATAGRRARALIDLDQRKARWRHRFQLVEGSELSRSPGVFSVVK